MLRWTLCCVSFTETLKYAELAYCPLALHTPPLSLTDCRCAICAARSACRGIFKSGRLERAKAENAWSEQKRKEMRV